MTSPTHQPDHAIQKQRVQSDFMAIPKTIYQTFKTERLPLLTRWHIHSMRRRNPEYDYQFYSDERIHDFIQAEWGNDVFRLYQRIQIGAAKADFFRYAILYKKGGVYLDIDSLNKKKLSDLIQVGDSAIISLEKHQECFAQWALIFEAGHPFLEKTMEIVLDNLKNSRYPRDVHRMTGPGAFTLAIQACLAKSQTIPYREVGVDYDGFFQFHYRFSKFFLYGIQRKEHWRTQQREKGLLKELD